MLFHMHFPVNFGQLTNENIIKLINQSVSQCNQPVGHQLFTWSWAPPLTHHHLGCRRSAEPGCCTSFPPDQRRCTCRCNRASCCWWTAWPLWSAASSAQLLCGPNGCSAERKTNSFYILGRFTWSEKNFKLTGKHQRFASPTGEHRC